MSDNINAVLSYAINGETNELDAVLTMLRKHGVHPTYFEYDAERDARNALDYTPAEVGTSVKQDVQEEQRTTHYDSATGLTTVTIAQVIKGEITY